MPKNSTIGSRYTKVGIVWKMSSTVLVTALTARLPVPTRTASGIPISTDTPTATKVTISRSMASDQ